MATVQDFAHSIASRVSSTFLGRECVHRVLTHTQAIREVINCNDQRKKYTCVPDLCLDCLAIHLNTPGSQRGTRREKGMRLSERRKQAMTTSARSTTSAKRKTRDACEAGATAHLVANSTPIVDLDSRLNSLRVNRESRFDLPTPESPISTTVWEVELGRSV